ncbi:MAG: ferrichrome ABC transporter substrate-binding protein [Xanthobacteraceae bacterium]|nr:ferrichrome ABC transporter substrate-binding protein [Xanthobacteraceae bacterium]
MNNGSARFNNARLTRQPRKLSLVLTLTLALLVSLAHCATCDLAFSGNGSAALTSSDGNTSHSAPDKQLPACSGHCLSHLAGIAMATVIMPADIVDEPPSLGHVQSPASLAGLPLFEPPRA